MGSDTLPPISLAEALGRWQWAPVVTVITATVAVAYLWGVFRVARRHPARPWPRRRTALFLAGLLVVVLATESGVGSYDEALFWDHMIQHLMLIMIAPALLVGGQPVTLLLHASRNPLHTWTKRFVRSRAIAALTWPPLGIALYTATIVGTHLTGFMNLVLTNGTVHNAEHVLYLVVGYLYLLPLIGSEPIRWRLSYPIRMIFLFIAMPVDAFTGVALGSYSSDPFPVTPAMHRPWGPAPLDDVHIGGAVMWVGGSAIMFVLIMIVFLSWARSGQRSDGRGWLESARRASLADLTAAGSPHAAAASSAVGRDRIGPTAGANGAGRADGADGVHRPAGAGVAGVSGGAARYARADRTDIDDDEDQLAAYNAFLARINQGSEQSRH